MRHKNELSIAEEVISFLKLRYPDLDLRDFIKKDFCKAVFGDMPEYSGRFEKGYQVCPVTAATISTFAICHAYDLDIGEWVFVATKKSGSDKIGLLGGFLNLDDNLAKNSFREQPEECLVREISEESRNDNGVPVLDITSRRARIIYSGIDYSGYEENLQSTQNTGYSVHLSQNELVNIKLHARKTRTEDDYADRVEQWTDSEVRQVVVIPFSILPSLGNENFRNTHELICLRQFHSMLYVGFSGPRTGIS